MKVRKRKVQQRRLVNLNPLSTKKTADNLYLLGEQLVYLAFLVIVVAVSLISPGAMAGLSSLCIIVALYARKPLFLLYYIITSMVWPFIPLKITMGIYFILCTAVAIPLFIAGRLLCSRSNRINCLNNSLYVTGCVSEEIADS